MPGCNLKLMEVLDNPNHTTLFSFKLFILFWGITDWFGFPDGSDSKESTCNVRNLGSIPGLWRSPGGGHGNPPQYPCLGNSHGQRSLAGNSPRGCKVGHDWATKHSIALNRLTTNVVIVLGEQRRDSSIHNLYPFSLKSPSHSGYHRAEFHDNHSTF